MTNQKRKDLQYEMKLIDKLNMTIDKLSDILGELDSNCKGYGQTYTAISRMQSRYQLKGEKIADKLGLLE